MTGHFLSDRRRTAGLILAAAMIGALVLALLAQHAPRATADAPFKASSKYAVLSQSPATSNALPASLLAALPPDASASDARLIRTEVSRGRMWIVPAGAGLCVVAEAGGTSCQTNATDAARGTALTLGGAGGGGGLSDGEVLVYGTVPDGVASVTLVLANGSEQTIRVLDNAWTADVMGPTDHAVYVDAAGKSQTLPAHSYRG